MNIHDIANQLPPLSAEDLETLVEDIDQHGQLVPAIVDEQGLLLDGRHRLIACQRLGIELRTVVFTGSEEEKRALSRSHNDVRRHLSEIQRSLRANDAAQLKRGTNRYEEKVEATTVASTTTTISEAAKKHGVSVKSVQRVRYVSLHGIEELQAALRAERVSLLVAAQIARMTPAEQRKCIKNGFKLPKKPKTVEQKPVVEDVAPSPVIAPEPQPKPIEEKPVSPGPISGDILKQAEEFFPKFLEALQALDRDSPECKVWYELLNKTHAAATSHCCDMSLVEQVREPKKVPGALFPDAIEEKPQKGRMVPTDEEFEAFYKAFPRKVTKAKSKIAFEKAFKTLRKKHDPETAIKTIMSGVAVYVSKANPDALCHPTTWLNGERWDDDPESIGSPTLGRATRGRDIKSMRYGTYDESVPVLSVEEEIRRAKS